MDQQRKVALNKMTDFETFLLWEAKSRDTIDFKKVYVDIADDLIAGLLLSQIIYWYLPDKHGKTKLRVQKNGYYWIAKGRDDWHAEIRISAKQFDRASSILVKKGILVKDYFMFDSFRTVHIRLDYDRFMKLWQEQLESGHVHQRVRPVLTKGEDRNVLKGKTGLTQELRPITESTTKNTNIDITLEKKSSVGDLKALQTQALDLDLSTGPDVEYQQSNKAKVPNSSGKSNMSETDAEDELTNVFGINPRQAEIDSYDATGLNKDELLLVSMGAGVSPKIHAQVALIRESGWNIRDGEVESLMAQFFDTTGFVIPSSKKQRNFFVSEVRNHKNEEQFSGRVPQLYELVWDKVSEAYNSGDLELSSPKSFTNLMYGVVNREQGQEKPDRSMEQIKDAMQRDGLIEFGEVSPGKYAQVWADTKEAVNEIPEELLAKYI